MTRMITPLRAVDELRGWSQAMDRLFSETLGQTHQQPWRGLALDILEKDGQFIVKAAVPGLRPENIEVEIEQNVLTLKGESREEQEYQEAKVYRREQVFGSFARSVRLPEGLDTDHVEATVASGILTVRIPRLPEEKPATRKIEVRSIESEGS